MIALKQKVIPHLWFEKEAKEAAAFYASVFPKSKVTHLTTLHGTPSGDCNVITFELWEQKFVAFDTNTYCKFTPAISFIVNFDPLFFGSGPAGDKAAREQLDSVWKKLSEGGKALMPLDKYFFSDHYGWIQDKYGVSWQLILTKADGGEMRPPIIPSLMFVGKNAGRAEEAIKLYLSVFRDTKMGEAHRYGPNQAPDKEGTLMFADFMLEGSWFAAMDSAQAHDFTFNEAISLLVSCADQKEVDYFYKLSAVPEAEQCGWIKDKFGVSWQIAPAEMAEMLTRGTREQIDRVTQAFMPMERYDLEKLRKAYQGK